MTQRRNGPRVGVFGLGSMGGGMARVLDRAGFAVLGFDVCPDAVARFAAAGGTSGALPGDAEGLEIAVVVVMTAAQTEALLFGPDGIAGRLAPGAVVIGCATMAPSAAAALAARAEAAGLDYLDAPISGGAGKAADGSLTILASGQPAALERARPVLDALADRVFDLGPAAGAGSAMKAVNQVMAGSQIAVMAEAMALGLSQGIAPATVIEVISQCAGASFVLADRGPHVAEGDYRPRAAVDIWPKDLGIVRAIAAEAGLPTPMTDAALARFVAAAEAGLGGQDDAAVVKLYARAAGLALPGEDGPA
jgi:3-hydroxyisobutyrate dehydrogenase-like beta-hydroxyacid dehydrogenase